MIIALKEARNKKAAETEMSEFGIGASPREGESMSKRQCGAWRKVAILLARLALATAAAGQQRAALRYGAAALAPIEGNQAQKSAGRITPEEAKKLFALVDELIEFSSEETGLPVKSAVKRQLTNRTAVESYLEEKFKEDDGAKRLQRDEIVLKKFGMLDRDFELKPFLLALLKEQIEAYYDAKTKTVNLLDWVDAEEQKPVMAHELTHALQDQHSDLEKWDDQTPIDVSRDADGDRDHLAKDEMDTARDAVVEGQATAVMMDYILKPLGKSLVKDPEVIEAVREQMASNEDSPMMARAPLLLSESMLFPYRDGLSFEQDVWMDQGRRAAFAGALDRPPTSSWEIINPREYERQHSPAIPRLPNIHPLVDALYQPYDIGQIGQLDVHILTELYGGENAARDLTPAWNGGIYWAGQLRAATPAEQASTKSLGLFYLSVWKNADSAETFAKLYGRNLVRKYAHVHRDEAASDATEQIYSTDEGPVLIAVRDQRVFVAESFSLSLARQLAARLFDAQGSGESRMAARSTDGSFAPYGSLTSGLIDFFGHCGVFKAAVDPAVRAAR